MRMLAALVLAFLAFPEFAEVRAQTLTVKGRAQSQSFSRAQLLADPRLATVPIAHDPVFKRAMTYRAIPIASLLEAVKAGPDDYVQARAVDDFSVAIPAGPMLGGTAWLAIEDPARPWPVLTKGGKSYSAGPFYIVWSGKAPVSSEYWAYQLAALTVTDSPAQRWPQLAVGPEVGAGDPVRRGLEKFTEVCLACHRFRGAGEGTQGPDLGQPMNPADYLKPGILKKLLRDPDSVRSWPERRMPPFTPEMLSDADLDGIEAWLAYKARPAPEKGR